MFLSNIPLMLEKRFYLWLVIITVLAFFLRSYNLGYPSFWIDELHTINDSLRFADNSRVVRWLCYVPYVLTLKMAGIDSLLSGHPELWLQNGISETLARWPSVLLGSITVLVLPLQIRKIFNSQTALLFGLILAMHPWHIWISQSARFYVQVFLFLSIGLLCYARFCQTERRGFFIFSLFFLTLSFFSQPITGLMFGVIGIHGLATRKKDIQTLKLAIPLIFAVLLCFLALVYDEVRLVNDGVSKFVFQGPSSFKTLLNVVWGISPLIAIGTILSIPALFRTDRKLVILIAIAILIPGIFILLASPWLYIFDRYIIVMVLMPCLLAVSNGISKCFTFKEVRKENWVARFIPISFLLAAFVISLMVYYTKGYGNRAPWRDAVNYVMSQKSDNESLLVSQRTRDLPVSYYSGQNSQLVEFDRINPLLDPSLLPAWYFAQGSRNPFSSNRRLDGSAEEFLSPDQMEKFNVELKGVWYNQLARPHQWIRVYYIEYP